MYDDWHNEEGSRGKLNTYEDYRNVGIFERMEDSRKEVK